MKYALLTLTALTISGCSSFERQPERKTHATQAEVDRLFNAMDMNGDGYVTPEEMRSALSVYAGDNYRSGVVYGLESSKKKARKKLTEAEIKRIVQESFNRDPSSSKAKDKITKENFRTIVVTQSSEPIPPWDEIL